MQNGKPEWSVIEQLYLDEIITFILWIQWIGMDTQINKFPPMTAA